MKKMNKTGQFGLQQLSAAAIAVVVFIIVVGISASVLGSTRVVIGNQECLKINTGLVYNETNDQCQFPTNATVYGPGVATNTSTQGLSGLALFGDFTSIIVLVAIAAVILALIAVAFRSFA